MEHKKIYVFTYNAVACAHRGLGYVCPFARSAQSSMSARGGFVSLAVLNALDANSDYAVRVRLIPVLTGRACQG